MVDFVALILFVPAAIWLVLIVAQGLRNWLVKVDARWAAITTLASVILYFSARQLRGYAIIAALPILFMVGASLFNGIAIKHELATSRPHRLPTISVVAILGVICWALVIAFVKEH